MVIVLSVVLFDIRIMITPSVPSNSYIIIVLIELKLVENTPKKLKKY